MTEHSAPLNFVWLSLEQGMQCRSNYFQYPVDRPLHRRDVDKFVSSWGAVSSHGPGNFHLPDKLDPYLENFISFENMFTSGTSTVSSLSGGFTGIPHFFHSLVHSRKTDPVTAQVHSFATVFERLRAIGYKMGGFHLFANIGTGFIIPDLEQGWTEELRSWPEPFPSHLNYLTPVVRLENYLRTAGPGPHAICVHDLPQVTPAVLEVLAQNDITSENSVIVIVGDHGHPNWDLDGKQWLSVHDLECDEMNTHVYSRISYPGVQARSIPTLCSTLDIFPTVSRLLNIEVEIPESIAPICGVDLFPLLEGEKSPEDRTLRICNRYHFQLRSRITALRKGRWRYQYMHDQNVYLHDYHRLNGIKIFDVESLHRQVAEGFESPVNIENSRVEEVLQDFRRKRLEYDLVIQRFWLESLRNTFEIPSEIEELLESIDPHSSTPGHLLDQIRTSTQVDSLLTRCVESHLGRSTDTHVELRRMVLPQFYFDHLLGTFPEIKEKRVAIWNVDDYYSKQVQKLRSRINPCYVITEDSALQNTTVGGVRVLGPDALASDPVDLVIILSHRNLYENTRKKIQTMALPHPPQLA